MDGGTVYVIEITLYNATSTTPPPPPPSSDGFQFPSSKEREAREMNGRHIIIMIMCIKATRYIWLAGGCAGP